MEELSENESIQRDEILALSAIYESDWVLEDPANKVYSIILKNSTNQSFYFQVTFPSNYPLCSPPYYSMSKNKGSSIVFLWIEEIKEVIQENINTFNSSKQNPIEPEFVAKDAEQETKGPLNEIHIEIKHGSILIDRKSVFQAHAAVVNSLEEIEQFLETLKENRKIATATHNIMSYRILKGQNVYQDSDDDGEARAGGNLLRLLQILDAKNIVVVVSRWYGGIHLGSARFKHINEVARKLLVEEGFVKQKTSEATKS